MSVLMAGAILVLLIYGKTFLLPVVLACLLTSLLTTAIMRLEKLGFPTWFSAVIAISAGLVGLVVIGLVLQSQAGALEQAWPQYTSRLQSLLADISSITGPEFVARIETAVSKLDAGKLVASLAGAAGGIFGDIALILLYTGFLLAERGTLRTKLNILIPGEDQNRELNDVLNTVGRGIRRYLSIKTAVSALTGLLTYAVLKIYGVHFAELSGLLAFMLNFIPVIGSAIAVVIPAALALMQFDSFAPVIQVTALLACAQGLVGNVVEPKMMGRTLNLSPFVVMLTLTFWTTIWGMAGAFLSVPITASAVIVCRDIPSFRWLAVLLSADGQPEASEEPVQRRASGTPSGSSG